jgi:fermentation-respiration switch protein FrsA (DUF1100 family)
LDPVHFLPGVSVSRNGRRYHPFSMSERLNALAAGKRILIAVPGGGHNDLDRYPLYHRELDRILKGEPARAER